jgi:hypothetical protein
MSKKRFPYEQSEWHCGESERWLEALERYGTENIRAILNGAYSSVGAAACISVGTVLDMTKGFAQEWLAWHDREKAKADSAFRVTQIYWTRWAALAATVVAVAGVIGWIITILQTLKK